MALWRLVGCVVMSLITAGHPRNRIWSRHGGGPLPRRDLARKAGYGTKVKKLGFLPTKRP